MTSKKKKYDIVNKGTCPTQTENFVAVKQFMIINENGKRYLLVKLVNNRTENVTGATLLVEQFDDRGDKIASDSVRVSGFDGYPQKSFAVEDKIVVAPTCIDCRVIVTEAEFGKYTYAAGEFESSGYRFETDEPEITVPAAITKKAGKKGVAVEPRSLKMPMLILFISIVMLIVSFVAIWIYTSRFISTEGRFLHDGVYYSFDGNDRSDDSDIYVVGVRGSRSEITVPAAIEGHNVVRVDTGAFLGNSDLKKVNFLGDISIYARAFFGCTSLESINLKNAVSIYSDAFTGCTKLKSVELEKIVNISESAFNHCSALTSVKIADGEQPITIGYNAFANCDNLRTVDIDRTMLYDATRYTIFENCLNVRSLHLKNFVCGSYERTLTDMFGDVPALSSIIIDSIDTVGASLCEGLFTVTTVRFNDITTPKIGDRAFFDCEKLTEVIMPAAATEVGDEAFFNTSVASFDGSALVRLGDGAFGGCKSLSTFTLNKDTKLTAIGDWAFEGCESLKSTIIPTKVTSLGEGVFSGCAKLETVTFDDESKIIDISKSAFENCSTLGKINIPASVRRIEDRAFAGCRALSDITIHDGLTIVGEEAFDEAGLTEITLPDSVISIGCGAFKGCEKLQSISTPFVGGTRGADTYLSYIFGAETVDLSSGVVPKTLKAVTVTDSSAAYDNAFSGCADIESVIYNKGLTHVGNEAFFDCSSLSAIQLEDGLSIIGERAFFGCGSLAELTLPDSVTAIESNAFTGCSSLETLTTPFVGASRDSSCYLAYMFGGESFEDFAVIPASLKKVELTDTVTVGESAFADTAINEVVLGEATTAIAENAFHGNRRLNVITLPENLAEIGDGAFFGCYFLYEVFNYSELKLTAGATDCGYVAYYALKIHEMREARLTVVQYDGYDFVQNEDNWYLVRCPEGRTEFVLPAAVATADYSFIEYSIYDRLFIENEEVTTVYAPSNVKSIGRGAFSGCVKLSEFTFPSGITTIADELFNGCSALKKVIMPSAVDRIGERAFFGCAIDEIVIPTGCLNIGECAFSECTSLTAAVIPDSCTEIFGGAFSGCTMLYSVNIPSACETIGELAFGDCKRIKSVTLPASLNSIGNDAFSGCTKLYEVYNLSRFTLMYGTKYNGCVAEHAYKIHTVADSVPLENVIIDGAHYYKLDDLWSLVDYYGTDGNLNISGFMFGDEQVNDIIVIECAFQNYNTIVSVNVGDAVSCIDRFAFDACSELARLDISASELSIRGRAFAKCEKLTALTVLSGNVEFETEAFAECGLTSISLTGGEFSITDFVFSDCTELYSLTVDCESLTVFTGAFFDGLVEADIKCSTKFTASNYAFNKSKLEKLTVHADVVDIAGSNFSGADVSYINIVGKTSVGISSGAFSECIGLSSLSITGGRVDIGPSAIMSCVVGEFTLVGDAINENALVTAVFFDSAVDKLDIACNGDGIVIGTILNGSNISALTVRGEKVKISENAFFMNGTLTSLEVVAAELEIANSAFFAQRRLQTVTLTASRVAEIGESAFVSCDSLETLVLPAALKTIRNNAFSGCASLTELDIPVGVTSIADGAFFNCATLERLTLPDGLISIGNNAFRFCSALKSLTLPSTVVSIGDNAFFDCRRITVLDIPSGVTSISDGAFYNCISLERLTLPDGLIGIGDSSFQHCYMLKSLVLPDTVETLDDNAFFECNSLTSLVLSSSLKTLGDCAFYNCERLTAVSLPANLTYIGRYAFSGCISLKSLTVPENVTKIDKYAFEACSAMETLDFLGVPELFEGAFFGCNALKSLVIPSGIISIPVNAFENCYSLASLTIPNSVMYIGNSAFSACKALTKLEIPRYVSSISDNAFGGCNALTELSLPDGLTSIGANAFESCTALAKLLLPSSLTYIGPGAFFDCRSLAELTINTIGALDIDGSAFTGCSQLTKLELKNIGCIGFAAFGDCVKLESLSLHLAARANYYEYAIGDEAFRNCYALKTITVTADADTYVSIGSQAFNGCGELTALVLPSTLVNIGVRAFAGCSKLRYVELPESLRNIEYFAFTGATSLFAVYNRSGLDIPVGSDDYTYGGVAKYAAVVTDNRDLADLSYVEIGKNKFVISGGTYYLYECEIDAEGKGLPESSDEIKSYVIKCHAFDDYIDTLLVPKSVASVQSYAFYYVFSIVYEGTKEEWNNIEQGYGNQYYNVYCYVKCVHDYGEWTEIDGEISITKTMSDWTVVKEATCTEKGELERHCDRCGKEEKQEIPIDPYAHDYDEDGTCNNCGAKRENDEYYIDTYIERRELSIND